MGKYSYCKNCGALITGKNYCIKCRGSIGLCKHLFYKELTIATPWCRLKDARVIFSKNQCKNCKDKEVIL